MRTLASAGAEQMAEAKRAGRMRHPPFRHGLRDRLRAIECLADIIDAIGGWSNWRHRPSIWPSGIQSHRSLSGWNKQS